MNDVVPPELLPPLLLVGDVHGSLGIAVADGSAEPLAVGAGVSAAARPSLPDDGLRLSIGSGSDVDEGDGEPDADPDGIGDALDCRPHIALCTGSAEGDSLDVGEADADVSEGNVVGLSEGRSAASGPPPSANAVAVMDANTATVVAHRATDLRVIESTSDPVHLPATSSPKPTKPAKLLAHAA